jgi:P pilus assembly chaperone PapD
MKWMKSALLVGLIAISAIQSAQAGIIVGGSRVIYEAKSKEVSLQVKNPEKQSVYLIQTWVDNEKEQNTSKTPFIITPPLFRLDAGQENLLRIVFTGSGLPTDRETAYWLNVKSIPSVEKTDKNRLLISVNTRIKMFYRPSGLNKESAGQAYKQLTFRQQGNMLHMTNPTPYYVSFSELTVGGKRIEQAGMVPAKGEASLKLPDGTAGQITWKAINDYGGVTEKAVQ